MGGGGGKTVTGYTYTAAALYGLCEGAISSVPAVWENKDKKTTTALGMTVITGVQAQSAWSYLTSYHPTEALGYSGLALVGCSSLSLGSTASLPAITFEVIGTGVQSGQTDADASYIVNDLLTNTIWSGIWPSSYIGDLTTYQNYTRAAGLNISPVLSTQKRCADWLADIASATNSQFLMEPTGTLTVIPYADTSISGSGYAYTPPAQVYDLGVDDFLVPGNSDEPIKVSRKSPADCYNVVRVEYLDRANDYNVAIAEASDMTDIAANGLRVMQTVKLHMICDKTVARAVAQVILQRSLYVRNTYSFTLGWMFGALQPMDIVTLTDPLLGLDKKAVRITSVTDGGDDGSSSTGSLQIEAEEYPAGASSHALYTTASGSGYTPDYFVDPGSVNTPLLFMPPAQFQNAAPQVETWLAVSGSDTNWGGCNVWVSLDDSSYKMVGTINGRATQGTLSAALASGSDPDTTNTLSVDLTESLGTLLSGTQADADNNLTLCYVDGELISFETATLTASNKYDLTYLRRGQYDTTIAAHSSGTDFVRIDDAIFKYTFDPSLANTTLYFKFQSFNVYGGATQDISTLSAYQFTPSSNIAVLDMYGITPTVTAKSNYLAISWDAPANGVGIQKYDIYVGSTNPPTVKVASVPATTTTYDFKDVNFGTTYYVKVVPWDLLGYGTASSVGSGTPNQIQSESVNIELSKSIIMTDSDGNSDTTLAALYDAVWDTGGVSYSTGGWSWIQCYSPLANFVNGVQVWADGAVECYAAYSDDGATWSWLSGNATHGLDKINGQFRMSSQTDEASCQTDYWSLSTGYNFAFFPNGLTAKYCRLYFNTDAAHTIYELVFRRIVIAEDVIADNLSALSADMGTVTAGVVESSGFDASDGVQLDLNNKTLIMRKSGVDILNVDANAGTGNFAGTFAFESGSSGYGNINDVPTSLSDINTTEASAISSFEMVLDGDMEVPDNTYWDNSPVKSTTQVKYGTYSLRVTHSNTVWASSSNRLADGTSNFIAVEEGDVLFASAWVYPYSGAAASQVRIRIMWFDGSKTYVSASYPALSTSGGAWEKLSGSVTTPSGVRYALVNCLCTVSPTGGEYSYFDAVSCTKAEKGATAGATWGVNIDGSNLPADNADVTSDNIAGSGVNILPRRYSMFDASSLPPIYSAHCTPTQEGTAYLTNKASSCLKITPTTTDPYLYLGTSIGDYNISMTPNKKWIVSAYIYATTAFSGASFFLRTSDGTQYSVAWSHNGGGWERKSGVIDLSASSYTRMILRVDGDQDGVVACYVDDIMIEEQIGNLGTPSSYIEPGHQPVYSYLNDTTKIDGGFIYAGSEIEIGSGGFIHSGQTALNTGTGWFVGSSGTTPVMSLGIGSSGTLTEGFSWDGTKFDIEGDLKFSRLTGSVSGSIWNSNCTSTNSLTLSPNDSDWHTRIKWQCSMAGTYSVYVECYQQTYLYEDGTEGVTPRVYYENTIGDWSTVTGTKIRNLSATGQTITITDAKAGGTVYVQAQATNMTYSDSYVTTVKFGSGNPVDGGTVTDYGS